MTVELQRPANYAKVTLDHDATHYVLHWFEIEGGATHYAIETGRGSYYGQWIQTGAEGLHWSYLTEKMPDIRDGDFEGYRRLFALVGLEVFR